MRKAKIGDICEVKTPIGLAYVQYTHDGEDNGQLVRLLPGVYPSRPDDFTALASQKELYFTFFTLEYALRAKQIELVSNKPIPDWAKPFPIMRKRGGIAPEGGTLNWYIGHGLRLYTVEEMKRTLNVRELTPEQKRLSIAAIWSHPVLVEEIVRGWTPERDDELNLKAREERKRQKVEASVAPSAIDHYLYFPERTSADKAAKHLRTKGWEVVVRLGGDGENWLALAKQPAPIEENIAEVREELERLAEELHGEYDGWGAPV